MAKKSKVKKPIKQNLTAYLFLLPWLIGFIFFVAYPFLYTIFLSFNSVSRNVLGWQNEWIGFENYITAFIRNVNFNPLIVDFIVVEFTYVPAIIILGFILALLLNTNIKFRGGFRLIYFFPVVILSGPVMTMFMETNSTSLLDVDRILIFRMIESYSMFLADMLRGIFSNFTLILWFTGIPIVLFLNGLQKINRQMYEAAQIDGANSWQILWKITIPNLKSTALVVAIYSVVQLAIFEVNPIYNFVVSTISDNYRNGLGFAAAVVLIYSFIVLIFVGLIYMLLKDRDKEEYEKSVKERRKESKDKLSKLQKRLMEENETMWEGLKRIFGKKKGGQEHEN